MKRNKKTKSFASLTNQAGRFAATSLEDMRKAGREAGQVLKKLK